MKTFPQYARNFVVEIKEAGAEPILLMAWPYERLGCITMDEIAQAHFDIALELGVDVAPVGLVWQRAMKERPKLDMYDLDAEHPCIYGTYLAVNVVYATAFGENPVDLTYLPPEGYYFLSNGETTRGVTNEEAAFLQTHSPRNHTLARPFRRGRSASQPFYVLCHDRNRRHWGWHVSADVRPFPGRGGSENRQ